MKFALVFLIGCFAIATQASSLGYFENDLDLPIGYQLDFYAKDGLVERLRQLIEAVAKKVKEVVDDIVAKADEIVGRIVEKIKEIVGQSEGVIKRILEKILEKIDEIAQQGEVAKKCVDENRPAIQAAVQDANQKLQVCGRNAIDQSQNIIKDVKVHVDAIHANIDALKALVNKCVESGANPIEVAKCVGGEAKVIHDNVLELVANARKALDVASERAAVIAKEAVDCSNKIVKELEEKLSAITENIEKCLTENSKPRHFYLN